jgi:hypothetical protein
VGALIVLFIRLMIALVTALVYLSILLVRISARIVAIVVRVTAQLIQQTSAKTRSPDGRFWWNGQRWVPMLGPANWAVPIGALAGVVLIGGVCTAAAMNPQPTPSSGIAAASSPESFHVDTPSSQPSSSPSPTPPPSPTPSPSPSPVAPASTAPAPPPAQNLCGAPQNPWGYNFCGGALIYSPPGNFCLYFNCIPSFWKSTNGYVDECRDGTYSHSGGRQGACSYHGGEMRPLYA